jgi:protein-tyrosine-phosphatase
MVDALWVSDRTFQELAEAVALPGNLAAHHLAVLESAGLIERHRSEGDHRRRYISLRRDRLDGLIPSTAVAPGVVVFVCTRNSARSQFAAALWRQRTGSATDSAGTDPAERIDPRAVRVAAEYGLEIAGKTPKGYADLDRRPDLVVSVCDRARESGLQLGAPSIHWSIPDPVPVGTLDSFRGAFAAIAARIDRLSGSSASQS